MPTEYTVRWSGGRIGAGASVFHMAGFPSSSTAATIAADFRTYFEAIKGLIPTGIRIDYDSEMRNLTATGELTGVVSFAAPNFTAGSGAGAWLNGAGGCVRWSTASVIGGRRLTGRTFIVPMVAGAGSNGLMSATTIGTFNAAQLALIVSVAGRGNQMQVFSRKNAFSADITAGTLLERPSSLRTRNDRL